MCVFGEYNPQTLINDGFPQKKQNCFSGFLSILQKYQNRLQKYKYLMAIDFLILCPEVYALSARRAAQSIALHGPDKQAVDRENLKSHLQQYVLWY